VAAVRAAGVAWAVPAEPELLPRAPRNNEEARLQAAVMAYLAWALPANAIANHSPGEGKRTRRAQGDLRRSGYQAGWPDIEVIYNGRSCFIELKAKRGVLSAAQREMQRRLIYCGSEVCLCRSVPEVEQALREIGIPLRARVAV
jgi:hypothetical protein